MVEDEGEVQEREREASLTVHSTAQAYQARSGGEERGQRGRG